MARPDQHGRRPGRLAASSNTSQRIARHGARAAAPALPSMHEVNACSAPPRELNPSALQIEDLGAAQRARRRPQHAVRAVAWHPVHRRRLLCSELVVCGTPGRGGGERKVRMGRGAHKRATHCPVHVPSALQNTLTYSPYSPAHPPHTHKHTLRTIGELVEVRHALRVYDACRRHLPRRAAVRAAAWAAGAGRRGAAWARAAAAAAAHRAQARPAHAPGRRPPGKPPPPAP